MPSVQCLELNTIAKTSLCTGKVMVLCAGDYLCESESRRYKAKKAHDCLLLPQIGDTVLLLQSGTGVYILNILERGPVAHHLYHFPGDTAFMMEHNFMQTCGEYRVQSRQYGIQSDAIQLEAKHLTTQTESAHFKSKILDIQATLLRRQIKRLYHFVEQFEHQVVGRMRTIVKRCLRIEADETRLYSKGVTKIDGDHIHLG